MTATPTSGPSGPLFSSPVGDAVRRLRKKLKWSQAGMADRIGVSSNTVCLWEADRNVPRHAQLRAFRDLALTVDYGEVSEIFTKAMEARPRAPGQPQPRLRRGNRTDAMFAIADAIADLAKAVREHHAPAWPLAMRDADEAAERHLEAKS